MLPAFWTDVIAIFILLFLGLIGLKVILVIYRISSKKWPASPRFIWKIIDWQAEAKKILFLVLLALLLAYLKLLSGPI